MKKSFNPQFNTPPENFCKEEFVKLNSRGLRGDLYQELRDDKPDIAWESEQLAKSHGIYLEYNRAMSGDEKEWIYMIRFGIPGGGPISRSQWLLFDELSEKYTVDPEGSSSLRLTTRQNIQFHWIKKQNLIPIIKTLAEAGRNSLNGCGDNMRNVLGCPLSDHSDLFNARRWAQRTGEYFQLPLDPFIEIFAVDPHRVDKPAASFAYGPNLLNRKFKIAFSAIHKNPLTGQLVPDNCVEVLTNDVGVVPIVENHVVKKFQIYIGGGQGERNGKPSLACLAQPLGIVAEDQLLKVLDGIVHVHQAYGDRQNRVWARLKFVVKKMGIAWYRDQVTAKVGFSLEPPDSTLDIGDRHLHHGWHQQPDNGLFTFGAFVETGRITDAGPNGRLKTMVREMVNTYPVDLMITPNQDLLFTNIPPTDKESFETDLRHYGYGFRNSKPYSRLRVLSGACVGRDTCRLTYTDSERFEPFLIDELEAMGWGDLAESVGVTGCERQCFRPATKSIGLVGSGFERYQFVLFGDETARVQGTPLIASNGEELYLRSVPREKVAQVIDVLLKFYKRTAQPGEGLGAFHRRIGADAIIGHLKENPLTAQLMDKPFNTDCMIV
ncbi:MAG TPA: nitrite reductase [Candidatus Omnitrophica bacterium]|nr:MAG: hypothetical protein A2Z81_03305 [Omnitrophica WOR_2 bacterium GWA2_45_18]HBR14319.1 nitrite reductase [Candidatus Omnitrophota bacterium]